MNHSTTPKNQSPSIFNKTNAKKQKAGDNKSTGAQLKSYFGIIDGVTASYVLGYN